MISPYEEKTAKMDEVPTQSSAEYSLAYTISLFKDKIQYDRR